MLDRPRAVLLEGPCGETTAEVLASFGADVTRVASANDAHDVLSRADLLISSAAPEWARAQSLDPASVAVRYPRLIVGTITPFGFSGPHADYRGGELVCSAMSGVLRLVGYPDRAPVKEALDACTFHAEVVAAAGLLIALHERGGSGLGQHVDVSIQEVAASRLTNALVLWQFDSRLLTRTGVHLTYGQAKVRCIWELQDGFAFHSLMSGRFGAPANAALSRWMDDAGCDNPLREVDWLAYDRSALPAETRELWENAIDAFFRSRAKREIAGEGRRRGINAAVLQEPSDILADPHLAARGFWRAEASSDGRSWQTPRYFVRTVGADAGIAARRRPSRSDAALAGLNVLDLSWALVGSFCTKALADHGATVVKVESARRPCLTRTDVQVSVSTRGSFDDKPWFAQLNTSKWSLQLDLKHPRAWDVLGPAVDWADIVVENFSPGTLHKLGLDYATLVAKRARPGLIMISGSAYGQTGPLAHEWGVDGTSAALSGRMSLTGYPDRPPLTPGAVPYADVVVPQIMIAALMSAVIERERTGAGCYIDVAMYEVAVQQMKRALIAAESGCPLRRAGNRDPHVLHQGVYPARGHDRWVAVSCFDAADWARFTHWLGGEWPDARGIAASDAAALDALDERIAERTQRYEDFACMQQLQAAGVAAGVVQDACDILERDLQLRARGAFVPLDHPRLGAFQHQASPHHLSRTPSAIEPAPLLGEHSERACCELFGLDARRYAELREAGLFV